jgi:methyl-accepting chemotaxis protein
MRFKWTIRARLIAGFMVVAALVLAVAVASSHYNGKIVAASDFVEQSAPRKAAAMEVEVHTQQFNHYIAETMFLGTPEMAGDSMTEGKNTFAEGQRYMSALLNGDPKLNVTKSDDPRYLAAYAKLAIAYQKHHDLGVALYEAHLVELKKGLPREQWMQAHNKAEEAFDPVMENDVQATVRQFEAMVDKDVAAAQAAQEAAEGTAARIMLLVGILGPALAIAVGLYVASSIMRPLRRATAAMEEIASGNVDDVVALDSDDEISTALNAMNATLAAKMRALGREQDRSKHMLEDLRRVAVSVVASADELAATAERISATTHRISDSAEVQSTATEQTSATIEEIAASIQQVAVNAGTLGQATDETAATIGEMSASIAQIAGSVDGLSNSVVETSASIDEMIVSISEVADHAKEVATMTDKAGLASENGTAAVETMVSSMAAVSEAIEGTAAVMKSLGKRSKEIGEITEVIDDIAEQTNLLALNAAIEAARAGEHGRGFAVVADAVRELAERATASTKEISTLIASIQEDTEQALTATVKGVDEAVRSRTVSDQAMEALDHVGSTFSEVQKAMRLIQGATAEQVEGGKQILSSVGEMKRLQDQVDIAIQEQATGSRQIVKTVDRMNLLVSGVVTATGEQKRGGEQMVLAMQNINATTRDNLRGIQELVSAATNLAVQSDTLRELVRAFDVETTGADVSADVSADTTGDAVTRIA